MSKVYSIVMKVRLDCEICYKKISEAICSICLCDIQSKSFDEEANTVTITGTFDPEKIMRKLCRKAGRWILSYEMIEILKEEECPPPPEPAPEPEPCPDPKPEPCPDPEPKPEPEPAPAPAPAAPAECEPAPAPAPAPPPEEQDKPAKNAKKKTKKKGGPVVVVVVPPPAAKTDKKPASPGPEPAQATAPAALAPEPPPPEPVCEPPVVAVSCPEPATGAPINWCYGGPCQQCRCCCGVHDHHPPFPCRCGHGRRHSHCGHDCVFFSEEDSMCRPM